jgi:MarR family transcriptional regulator, organic hydroperoxide resistance regulator
MGSEALEFGDALARVSRQVKAAAAEAMRELGVHAGQNFILEELAREDSLTPGELARRIGVEVSTITRAAQRMEAAGLVRRVRDDADARLVRVALSAEGRRVARRLPGILQGVYEEALGQLTARERVSLVRLLRQLAKVGDGGGDEVDRDGGDGEDRGSRPRR